MHRAIVSLQEEVEAIAWYQQRADACARSDGPRVVPAVNTYGLLTRSGAHAPLGEREQAAL